MFINSVVFPFILLQVHQAYQRQGQLFGYLVSCHDLWEQADNLVSRGNHTGTNFDLFCV
jgi:hypothetical protein